MRQQLIFIVKNVTSLVQNVQALLKIVPKVLYTINVLILLETKPIIFVSVYKVIMISESLNVWSVIKDVLPVKLSQKTVLFVDQV